MYRNSSESKHFKAPNTVKCKKGKQAERNSKFKGAESVHAEICEVLLYIHDFLK